MPSFADIFDDSDERRTAESFGLSVEDLQMFFNDFDVDGNGTISEDEFGTLLATMGKVCTPDVIHAMVKSIDKDENGVIDFKEFCSWWCKSGDSFSGRGYRSERMPEEGYDWDYELSEQENWQAEEKFNEEMYARRESEEEANFKSWELSEQSEEASRMLKAKLMAPFYMKKLARKIHGIADRPCDTCSNSLAFQIGQPEEHGSVKVYAKVESDFASLDAPKNAAAALVVDFSLQDDYCEESLKGIQETVDAMFKQFMEPMLGEVNQVPRELRKTGLITGKPFDSYRLQVEEVHGAKVLRLAVFSGVDALGGISKEAGADLKKLMPTASVKLTTGFNLADLFGTSGTPLKDMLQFKFETEVNWSKNYIRLAIEVMEMTLKTLGALSEDRRRREFDVHKMCFLSFCNFFVAQRSLFFFQFANIMDWVKEMIHEVGLPLLLKQIEKESPPFWKGPPSKETIDGVVDAVFNLTGKTFGAARQHLLDDLKLRKHCDDGARFGSILWILQRESRLKEALEEASKEDGDAQAKIMATLWETFTRAHKVFKGFNGARIVDKVAAAGVECKAFDFMQFVPSPDDILNAEGTEGRESWVELYGRNFTGDDSKGTVDPEFMAKLKEESGELAEVVKAAWALRECFDFDCLNEMSGGMATKAEDEAKQFFDIV